MCELCEEFRNGRALTLNDAVLMVKTMRMRLATEVAEKLDAAGVVPSQFVTPERFSELLSHYAEAHFFMRALELDLIDVVAQTVEVGEGDEASVRLAATVRHGRKPTMLQ